jgi:hypothetical protein
VILAKVEPISLESINVAELAKELTLWYRKQLCKVSCFDFALVNANELRFYTAPALSKLYQMSEKIQRWVRTEILIHPARQDRTNKIQYFVQLVDECFALHNYGVAWLIVQALLSPPVFALRKSWSSLPTSVITIFQQKIQTLCTNIQFSYLQQHEKTFTIVPTIPDLGVFSKEFYERCTFNAKQTRVSFPALKEVVNVFQAIKSGLNPIAEANSSKRIRTYLETLCPLPDELLALYSNAYCLSELHHNSVTFNVHSLLCKLEKGCFFVVQGKIEDYLTLLFDCNYYQ